MGIVRGELPSMGIFDFCDIGLSVSYEFSSLIATEYGMSIDICHQSIVYGRYTGC